ncbi:hypothetical protein GCM10010466_32380 [Planomonospora alba]|uniref:Uncharacterized protein n=1 Tax=Planomonospora alba TaxID=161354 RepID=A0ABP6N7D2_9ACTN
MRRVGPAFPQRGGERVRQPGQRAAGPVPRGGRGGHPASLGTVIIAPHHPVEGLAASLHGVMITGLRSLTAKRLKSGNIRRLLLIESV